MSFAALPTPFLFSGRKEMAASFPAEDRRPIIGHRSVIRRPVIGRRNMIRRPVIGRRNVIRRSIIGRQSVIRRSSFLASLMQIACMICTRTTRRITVTIMISNS